MNKYFKCLTTGSTWPLSPEIIGCPEHPGYYNDLVVDDPFFDPELLSPKTPLYPLDSFGKKFGFQQIYLKDESKNLTGSFKDRGAEELIKYLKMWKIKKCFVISCGNDAISTVAYAQKALIQCHCLVPESVNGAKSKLIRLYGGHLDKVKGTYETVFKKFFNGYSGLYNATGGYNAIKEEGMKKISYELGKLSEVVVIPCGNGTLLWAIYKGFKELKDMKRIDKLPKLIGVQVKGAAPLKTGKPVENPIGSIADGIVASESFSAPKVKIALEETGGEIIEVTNDEIVQGLKDAIKLESIIPEPTSAAVFAGAKKLKDKHKKTILILTAGGYKNLSEINLLY